MPINNVILEVVAEGGSIVLYGLQASDTWRFSLEFIRVEPDDGEALVDSWDGALTLLDRYPWPLLTPVRVHPDFRDRILVAVRERLSSRREADFRLLSNWEMAEVDSSGTKGAIHSSDSWLYDSDDQR